MPRFEKLTLRFNDSIAAAGSDTESQENQYKYPFIIQSVCFMALTGATVGSNIPAGTPFLRDFPAADLAAPSLSEIELEPEFASQRIGNERWNALLDTGDGRHPFYFQTEIELPAGGRIKTTLYNNSAVACTAWLVFNGYLKD